MKSELINVRPDARKESHGCNGTLEREEWRDVVGYEGLYQVSSFGRVRNPRRNNKLLTIRLNRLGYPTVGLWNGTRPQKTRTVHRLVMNAFVPNTDNLPMVNHRNEDKTANYPDNMEWCDCKYNINYGTAIARRASKNIGRHHSEESKVKMSISHKGAKRSQESLEKYRDTVCIPVCQFALDGTFIRDWKDAREAAEALNIDRSCIGKCCRNEGDNKSLGGFLWLYKRDFENGKTPQYHPNRTPTARCVLQISKTGVIINEWVSIAEAGRQLKAQPNNIRRAIIGERKTFRGFIWKYKSDYENEQRQ